MRFTKVLFAMFSVLLIASAAFSADPFMPRYPAISPDGSDVVFSFQGDLWKVSAEGGQAYRLTAHPAYDSYPVFSPDGSKIVFGSDRFGNTDIYVMASEGGLPTRLTYASARDIPETFSNDGKTIYFASTRLFEFPNDKEIYKVSIDGGTPFRFADTFSDEIDVTPEGNYVFAQGRVKYGRIHYRGSYQREIYSYAIGQDPVRLTDNDGYDQDPCVASDGTIYWISDQDESKTQNLWKMNADGSGKTQISTFEGDGVRSIDVSSDGSVIVLERATELYIVKNDQAPVKLSIEVGADYIENLVNFENFSGKASEVVASSDGKEYALVVHSEIILVNKDLGGRAIVPIPSPYRDYDIAFRPGSADTLSFVTDRFGLRTLCILVSDDPDHSNLRKAKKHKIVKLGGTKDKTGNAVWSPDGDKIAYTQGLGDIRIMNADGKKDRSLWKSWSEPSYSWSPDNQWLAVSREDRNYNQDVWILPADGSEKDAVNISTHPDEDFSPVWSADGSMISWTTRRHNNQYDVYFTYLKKEDDQKTEEEWELWEKTRDDVDEDAKKDEDEDKEDDEEEKEEELVVVIDFENINTRCRRVTRMAEGEFAIAIHPRGDRIFFTHDNDIKSVNRFGKEMENVTDGASPRNISFDSENETFYFLKHGKPAYIGMDGGSVETTDFDARLKIDKPAERVQIIEEGWNTMNNEFYDPDMHGVDWKGLRGKYSDWASKVSHDVDFSHIANFMLGELNASHMGYYSEYEASGDQGPCGYLGLEFDESFTGKGLKVERVLKDGPTDRVIAQVEVGDILLSINGTSVSATENLFLPLEGFKGTPVELEIKRAKETLYFTVTPMSYGSIFGLTYEEMELSNRAYVEEETKDKIGYLHIRGMGLSEVERFEMNLYAAANDKDALIIDVRDNGGGWTTDLLMTILTQPVHAYTIGRDGEIGYPTYRYPMFRWRKPIAVLCNEGSYSNAEIFSHAIQSNDRGPVIGMPTGGNVISTSGWTTIDGGWIRMPMRGWYVWGDQINTSRNHLNQEGNGCIPNHIVPLTPVDVLNKRDPQLDKAIELMKEAILDESRFKPVPDSSPHMK